MALLEHRPRIRFRAEHRSLGGVYECTAKNGAGDPALAHITVIVHGKQKDFGSRCSCFPWRRSAQDTRLQTPYTFSIRCLAS